MKYFTWIDGRQESCSYKKMCLWSFKLWKWGFDGYVLRYQANTDLPWHCDVVEGKPLETKYKTGGQSLFSS